ncbi:hypothetical protein [Micromonospora sp. L32]|uniref:hypothetical protein n=1 Tax=Micromonospora sp. L32 TaxID=3452214 RepID=UPI003F8B4F4E
MSIETSINALNMAAKYPARELLQLARSEKWHVEQVEKTIGAMAGEAHRLKDAWAAAMVDKDRQVRAASDRALDCTEHGKVIADLEQQVHQISQSETAHDKARGTLAVGLLDIAESLKGLQARASRGEQLPASKEIVDALAKAVAKLSERGRLK